MQTKVGLCLLMSQLIRPAAIGLTHSPMCFLQNLQVAFALNYNLMREGKCVLTYNWGNSFKNYLQEGTQLRGGRYGVARTPGSTQVLDRKRMELVDCDEDRCQHGMFYEDIGWVNQPTYFAIGGWACAVNNYTDAKKKWLAKEFCAFAASKEESINKVIPNATGDDIVQGQDPFRSSHLDLERYVSQGYESDTASDYIETLRSGLRTEHVVTDIRFPTAAELNGVLDKELFDHLNKTKHGLIGEFERASRRRALSRSITQQWQDIIGKYDGQGSTKVSVLESYQKLHGVYVKDLNQLGAVRWFGYLLGRLVMVLSILFTVWTIGCRKYHIVKASQPIFLVMICFGVVVLASSIFPLGIDDGIASESACNAACMLIPWLLALGWTIVFSALFAKLWRVIVVYKNSLKFRRVKVTEKDVLLPFAILFSFNVTVLSIWTALDPIVWKRMELSETESYGTCGIEGEPTVWKVCLSLIAVANGIALIMANAEACRARHISTEYGESMYVGLAMASTLQVVIVGLPLLFLADENPSALYFIQSSLLFTFGTSILLLLFVPKSTSGLNGQMKGDQCAQERRLDSPSRCATKVG